MTKDIEIRKKICILGDPAVGKTSILRRFVYSDFNDIYKSTIGTEITNKIINLNFTDDSNKMTKYKIDLAIWDIVGQKEYRALIERFYKNASGAFMVCDLTRKETLENLKDWTSSLFSSIGKVPVVFIGNKYDLLEKSQTSSGELVTMSCKYNAPWITTSAKEGSNVEEAFLMLGKLMIKESLHFESMSSLIDVLDAIIIDFCEVQGGLEIGMPIFKDEFSNIPGADFRNPTKDVVEELIKILIKNTEKQKGTKVAEAQNRRFNNWLNKIY